MDISTHSPHAGRTSTTLSIVRSIVDFNSLAPCGANRSFMNFVKCSGIFQLTRPMRGEPFRLCLLVFFCPISTHSPHAGRTTTSSKMTVKQIHFNSLAPCGANLIITQFLITRMIFQLTRPVRGEPLFAGCKLNRLCNFNSLAPCGANRFILFVINCAISFQLTRPVRDEPFVSYNFFIYLFISTHSPHAGRTYSFFGDFDPVFYFNSLAPCGANPCVK